MDGVCASSFLDTTALFFILGKEDIALSFWHLGIGGDVREVLLALTDRVMYMMGIIP